MLRRTWRCSSMFARSMSSLKRGIAVFSQLENTSLRRETSRTSSCRETTQKPSSWKPPLSGGDFLFHQTGAVRRSSANSSNGMRPS